MLLNITTYVSKNWAVMSLSKTLSMVVIATFLIGIGALTTLSATNDDHGNVHLVAADAHEHGDVDQSNPSSKHEHPSNQDHHQGNCCHSLACSGSAMFMMSTVSLIKSTGDRIPLLPITFVQGQPFPPSKRPPKLIA